MFNPKRLVFSTLLSLCIFGGAYAGTVGSTLDVSANVVPSCSVSTLPIVMGDMEAAVGGSATGSIDVTCSLDLAYNIALDAGLYYEPSPQRRMSDGSGNFLNYGIFTDGTFTSMWGDTDFGDTNTYPVVAGTGTGLLQSYPVPSGTAPGQDVPAGLYSDTVNVTIHY